MIRNIDYLLDKVRQLPELKKLNNFYCFEHIRKNLDIEIVNISFRSETLYIGVSHPTQKMILMHRLNEVNNILVNEHTCEYISQNLKKIYVHISMD